MLTKMFNYLYALPMLVLYSYLMNTRRKLSYEDGSMFNINLFKNYYR